MLEIRDLPMESCVTVQNTTSLVRVAEMAAAAGARYVLVRGEGGEAKGVQMTSVASWMAEQKPAILASEIPVIESQQVEPQTLVLEALSMMAHSRSSVLLVWDSKLGTFSVVQRSVLEMTFGTHAAKACRLDLLS
jgi:hypothetical protein